MCEVVSKNIALKNNNIVFIKKTLFFPKTHCFPTCALFYPIVLKRKIITGYMYTNVLVYTYPGRQMFWCTNLRVSKCLGDHMNVFMFIHCNTRQQTPVVCLYYNHVNGFHSDSFGAPH